VKLWPGVRGLPLISTYRNTEAIIAPLSYTLWTIHCGIPVLLQYTMEVQSHRLVIRHSVDKLDTNPLIDIDCDTWRWPDAIHSDIFGGAICSIGDDPGSFISIRRGIIVPTD